MRVKFVPADPAKDVEFIELGRNQLDELQALVGERGKMPTYIEQIKTGYLLDKGLVMLVDENGRRTKNQPVNVRAQELSLYPKRIIGDVVFVGWFTHHGEEEWTSYPQGLS